MIRLLVFSVAMLLAFGAYAFAEESAPSTPPANEAGIAFFEKRVRPLLHEHCGECHSRDSGEDNGELLLDSPSGIRKGGSRGAALVPSEPDASLLVRAVRYADQDLQMPPDGKLPEGAVTTLVEWVRLGAPMPQDAAPSPEAKAAIDWETARQFWSLRPLQRSTPPALPPSARSQNWIDAYVFAQLAGKGLSMREEADRRTLIRRVTFDLTGLPPTPDEVEAFIHDDRPDAYERVVNRLLASPHFGERSGRAWLDLARYTDVVASWLKQTGNAYLYRDWVVAAMNADRPYDEFVRLQLAADMLPDTPPHDLPALGYLGLSPTYWKELRLAPSVIKTVVAEEWEERIDAVSRTFLGLTVACARCHDHKFDPITMKDYYALAGVFASAQLADRPLVAADRVAVVRAAKERIEAIEAELKKLGDGKPEESQKLRQELEQIRRDTPDSVQPWAHVMEEASVHVLPDGEDKTRLEQHAGEPCDLPVFRRGNPNSPGEIAPRRFLAVFSSTGEPPPFRQGSGRRELADAVLSDAGPLAARVMANRIWARLFGRGLARTTSDFGFQGERPTHPELLDALAARLLEQGWSLKDLHRQIVLSAVYRQSSVFDSKTHEVDPENRLLWRMNRRRLDIESWRDAMLSAAGRLDSTIGGPPQPLEAAENVRRTIYGRVDRHDQNAMLRLYDFPEPSAHSPSRDTTTTPLQQLFVLNSPFVQRQAETIAERALAANDSTLRERITLCYTWLYSRSPKENELAAGEGFLQVFPGDDASQRQAWRLYAQTLLGLNEFMFVD